MSHVEEKCSEDVEVQRHDVSQWQNQHDHIYQVTWKQKDIYLILQNRGKDTATESSHKVSFTVFWYLDEIALVMLTLLIKHQERLKLHNCTVFNSF